MTPLLLLAEQMRSDVRWHLVPPAWALTLLILPAIGFAAWWAYRRESEVPLAARVLRQEHQVYPQAVRWFAEDRLRLDGGCVRLAATLAEDNVLIAPEVC